MLWTSSAFRRITNCFHDSRRPEAFSLLGDAYDGTSRRCQIVARPLNAESAQNRRLFTPGFVAAVSKSKTHIGAKCPHPNVYQYPRNACRISKSICQDACNGFRRYIPMAQQQDALYLSSLLYDSPDLSWADLTRHWKNFDHLSAISNNLGWTEERFQPPKSHQIVDGIHHQIKSSLFFSLFRTGQSLNLERKGKKQKTRFPKLKSKSRSVQIDEFSRKMYQESLYNISCPICAPFDWRH